MGSFLDLQIGDRAIDRRAGRMREENLKEGKYYVEAEGDITCAFKYEGECHEMQRFPRDLSF